MKCYEMSKYFKMSSDEIFTCESQGVHATKRWFHVYKFICIFKEGAV